MPAGNREASGERPRQGEVEAIGWAGSRRMMEFLELGYPYFPATVATPNLSRPDLRGLKGKEIASANAGLWETSGVVTDS